MFPLARVVGGATIGIGSGALLWSLTHWASRDFGLFLGYLLVSTAAAGLRIRLPNVGTPLSLHFFFVLICVSRLSLPETLAVAAFGAALQQVIFRLQRRADAAFATKTTHVSGDAASGAENSRGPGGPFRAAFEIAGAVTAAGAAYLAYHLLTTGTSAIVLMLAAAVYFVVLTVPAAAAASYDHRRGFAKSWREDHFWTFPHFIAGGGAAGLLSLLEQGTGWETALLIVPVIYWMYHSYRYYLQRLDQERRQVRDLGELHFRTIEALALAIEGHDTTKHGHLRRVSVYVTEVGKQLGLPENDLHALRAAALLHDIGKLAVPEHIITKPGKLTDAEFERVKIHPIAGAEILEQVQFPYPVAPIVRAHHEKWDGTGYPYGLKGSMIPLGARILAAVDCLDALLSDRYHRRALPLERAIEYLKSESGRSFDPQVVGILVARYPEFEAKVQIAERTDPRSPMFASGKPFLSRIAAARREEQQLFQLARELGNSLSLDETLGACALRIQSMCSYDAIAIYVLREDRLVAEYTSGDHIWGFAPRDLAMNQGMAGWVAQNRTPILNGDPSQDASSSDSSPLRSSLIVPLDGFSGVVGVVALYARSRDAFTVDNLRVLSAACTKAASAIENALKYTQAERSATTDALTGLPNARSLFLHLDSELARAKRLNHMVTVLVGDLDGFKQINDRFGHMEGNRALRAVGHALKNQCREYDFVARMGGDEFVVVLSAHRGGSIEAKIEQFRLAVEQAGSEMGGGGILGLSVGHASYPTDGPDAESLLAEADRRMYEMKQQNATHQHTAELRALGRSLAAGETVN